MAQPSIQFVQKVRLEPTSEKTVIELARSSNAEVIVLYSSPDFSVKLLALPPNPHILVKVKNQSDEGNFLFYCLQFTATMAKSNILLEPESFYCLLQASKEAFDQCYKMSDPCSFLSSEERLSHEVIKSSQSNLIKTLILLRTATGFISKSLMSSSQQNIFLRCLKNLLESTQISPQARNYFQQFLNQEEIKIAIQASSVILSSTLPAPNNRSTIFMQENILDQLNTNPFEIDNLNEISSIIAAPYDNQNISAVILPKVTQMLPGTVQSVQNPSQTGIERKSEIEPLVDSQEQKVQEKAQSQPTIKNSNPEPVPKSTTSLQMTSAPYTVPSQSKIDPDFPPLPTHSTTPVPTSTSSLTVRVFRISYHEADSKPPEEANNYHRQVLAIVTNIFRDAQSIVFKTVEDFVVAMSNCVYNNICALPQACIVNVLDALVVSTKNYSIETETSLITEYKPKVYRTNRERIIQLIGQNFRRLNNYDYFSSHLNSRYLKSTFCDTRREITENIYEYCSMMLPDLNPNDIDFFVTSMAKITGSKDAYPWLLMTIMLHLKTVNMNDYFKNKPQDEVSKFLIHFFKYYLVQMAPHYEDSVRISRLMYLLSNIDFVFDQKYISREDLENILSMMVEYLRMKPAEIIRVYCTQLIDISPKAPGRVTYLKLLLQELNSNIADVKKRVTDCIILVDSIADYEQADEARFPNEIIDHLKKTIFSNFDKVMIEIISQGQSSPYYELCKKLAKLVVGKKLFKATFEDLIQIPFQTFCDNINWATNTLCSTILALKNKSDEAVRICKELWDLQIITKSFDSEKFASQLKVMIEMASKKDEILEKLRSILHHKEELQYPSIASTFDKHARMLETNYDPKYNELKILWNSLELVPNLCKAYKFLPIGIYKKRLFERYDSKKKITEINQECKAAEEELGKILQDWAIYMQLTDFDRVGGLMRFLTNNDLLIKEKIVTSDERESVHQNLKVIKILGKVKEEKESIKKLIIFLNTQNKLKDMTEDEGILDKISSATKTSTDLINTFRKKDLLNLFSQTDSKTNSKEPTSDSNQSKLSYLVECIPLILHFQDKEQRHFHDMVVERNSRVKVDLDNITATQKLIECYLTRDRFESVFQFIGLCESISQKHDLQKLGANSATLIECSKDLLGDNLIGANTATDILAGSVMIFNYDETTQSYDIFCRIQNEKNNQRFLAEHILGLKGYEPRHSVVDRKSIHEYNYSTLLDLKVKLALFCSSRDSLDDQEEKFKDKVFYDISTTFVEMVSILDSIRSTLTYITRKGSVLNIRNLIERKLETAPVELSEVLQRVSPYELFSSFCLYQSYLVIKTNSYQVKQTSHKLDHFKILVTTLSLIKADLESQYFTSKIKYHELTYLQGFQKQFLCKHLASSPLNPEIDEENMLLAMEEEYDNEMDEQEITFTIGSLVKFMNIKETHARKLDGLLQCKVDSQPLAESTLEAIFNSLDLPKKQNSSSSNPVKLNCLCYTQPVDRYYALFSLIDKSESNKFSLSQLLLCSPMIVNNYIELFLERAFKDQDKKQYFIIDPHLLTESVLDHLLYLVTQFMGKQREVVSNYNLALVVYQNPDAMTCFNKILTTREVFSTQNFDGERAEIEKGRSFKEVVTNKKIEVVTSQCSGMGKSFYIRKEIGKVSAESAVIHLSGDPSQKGIERRLEIIDSLLAEHPDKQQLALHIKLDMMDNMQNSCSLIDQLLFQICCLRCIPYRKGYLFMDRIYFIFIEVQNSYKELIMNNVGVLDLFENYEMANFTDRQSLREALDIDEFTKSVNEDLIEEDVNTNEENTAIDDFICFYSGIKNGELGKKKLSDIKKSNPQFSSEKAKSKKGGKKGKKGNANTTMMEESKEETLLADMMFDMIMSNSQKITEGSWIQLITAVRVVAWQAREMDKVPGLDPNILKMDRPNQADIYSFEQVRLNTGKQIIKLSVELAWATAAKLKEEKTKAIELMKLAEMNQDLLKKDERILKEYEEKVKSLPKWNYNKSINYFFNKGSLKIIYREVKMIDHTTIDVIKHQTRQNPVDFNSKREGELSTILLNELSEALNLKQTLIVSQEYKEIFRNQPYDVIYNKYLQNRISKFNGGKGYVITYDNYLKILLIVQRALLHIPIVIMGATGCGKTYMIEFIAECLLQQQYHCFTLHSGVSEARIIEILQTQYYEAKNNPDRDYWLLFDEFNTSPLQCLISEIMVDRKSTFCKELSELVFPSNLNFVAACNPYRISSKTTSVGLINESSSGILSHRVYPIPDALINNLWDFGQLDTEVESQYINSMIDGGKYSILPEIKEAISRTISRSQDYLRKQCSDNSVSLRDVSRFADLYMFLKDKFTQHPLDPIIITAHLSYFCRLDNREHRIGLNEHLNRSLMQLFKNGEINFIERFKELSKEFGQEVEKLEVIPKSISLNVPLLENLLALYVCILRNIPLIICGKPGTSKSLSVSIMDAAFNKRQDIKDHSRFFKDTPKVMPISFWGSTSTTSESISRVFDTARENEEEYRRQAETKHDQKDESSEGPIRAYNNENFDDHDQDLDARIKNYKLSKKSSTNVYIVFDEIGLAEIAPDNPLKVLHPLLEPKERRVGFVGLSNWKLDQSKMNRVIYIARPDMDEEDLLETCNLETVKVNYSGVVQLLKRRMEALSKAFHKFRQEEIAGEYGSHNNFFGARDFYEIIKLVKRSLDLIYTKSSGKRGSKLSEEIFETNDLVARANKEELLDTLIFNAVQRNLSGKMIKNNQSFDNMIKYYKEFVGRKATMDFTPIQTMELIYQNLMDKNSRHLMIFTESSSVVEEIVISQIKDFEINVRKKPSSKFEYLCPVKGQEDTASVVKSKLPLYIKNGFTIVMKNLPEVYGCMYDLLNQNYTTRDAKGDKFCDLFYDNIKQTVVVSEEFKCIILMDREDDSSKALDLEKRQQPPLLNRFEKYLILDEHIIPPEKIEEKKKLEKQYLEKSEAPVLSRGYSLIHNLSKELIFSIFVRENSQTIENVKLNSAGDSKASFRDYLLELIKPLDKSNDPNKAKPKSNLLSKIAGYLGGGTRTTVDSQQFNESIVKLFSRNAIYDWISQKDKQKRSSSKNFKEDFLKTHPYNSLDEFIKKKVETSMKIVEECNRGAVYTYTPFWETKEIIKGKYQSIDCHEVETWPEGDGQPLLVLFPRRSQWKDAQPLRRTLEATAPPIKRVVIFVFHYSAEDFEGTVELSSGITYFNKNWEICVIDDLSNSNYKQFFELFDTTCSKFVEELNVGRAISMTNQIIKESIGSYLLKNVEKHESKSLYRILKSRDFLTSSKTIADNILNALKSTKMYNNKMSEVISSTDGDNDFYQKHREFDVGKVILAKINYFYKDLVYKFLDNFQRTLPLELIPFSELFDLTLRNELFLNFESAFKCAASKNYSDAINLSPYSRFVSVEINGGNLRSMASKSANMIRSSMHNKKDGQINEVFNFIKDQAENKIKSHNFLSFKTGSITCVNEADKNLLAAYLFDKYLEQVLENTLDDFVVKLIIQITSLINETAATKPYNELLNYYVLITEVYLDEILLISQLAQILDSDQKVALENSVRENFDTSGELLNREQIEPLLIIPTFKTKEDVQKAICNLSKLQEILSSKTVDRLDTIMKSGFKLLIGVLEMIYNVKNRDDFDYLIAEYSNINRTDAITGQSTSFTEFTLRFIANLNKSESVKYSLYKQTVTDCGSHFLEVFKSDRQLRPQALLILGMNSYLDCLHELDSQSNIMYLAEACTSEVDNFDAIKRLNEEIVLVKRKEENKATKGMCKLLNSAIISLIEKHVKPCASANEFVQQCLENISSQFTPDKHPVILSRRELSSFVKLKKLLKSITSSERASKNDQMIIDQVISKPFNGTTFDAKQVSTSLFLLRSIFNTFKTHQELKSNGFENSSRLILKWSLTRSEDFIFPLPEINQSLLALREHLFTETPIHYSTPQPTFYEQSEIFNFLFHTQADRQTLSFASRQLDNVPTTQSLFNENLLGDGRSAGTAQMRYVMLGVFGLVEILPRECAYSAINFSSGQFRPMVNYPEQELKRLLPVVQLYEEARAQQARDPRFANDPIFTELWECTTPNCRSLVPIGNCGQIGHTGDARAVGRCLGCNNQIGRIDAQNTANSGLRKVGIQTVIMSVNQLKTTHEHQFRQAPLQKGSFDESWILDIYHKDIKNKQEALFIHVIQTILQLFMVANLERLNRRATRIMTQQNELYEIIANDFNLLVASIGRPVEEILIMIMMTLHQFYRVVSNPSSPNFAHATTAGGTRILLAHYFRITTEIRQKIVADYLAFKSDTTQKATTQMTSWLSYVKSQTSSLPALSSFLSKAPLLLLNKSHPGIEKILQHLKRQSRRDEHSLFLVKLFDKLPILKDLRRILVVILRLGIEIKKLIDTKMTKEDAKHHFFMNSLLGGAYNEMLQLENRENKMSSFDNEDESKLIGLKKAAEEFAIVCRETITNLLTDHNRLFSNRFECENVEAVGKIILDLHKLKAPVLSYVVSDCRDPGKDVAPEEIAMLALLTDLTNTQNDILDEFKKLSLSRSARGFPSKPVYSASPENFICLNQKEFEEEVKRHSHYLEKKKKDKAEEMGQDDDEEAIAVDVRYLAEKYADELFCHSCILSVEPCVRFLDSDSRSLRKNITTLYSRMKIDDSQANQKRELPKLDKALEQPCFLSVT
jgi:hypothetical protein